MKPIEKSGIIKAFSCGAGVPEIILYDMTDSTNKRALLYASEQAPTSPVLFVAGKQSAGRGRLGRSFISPDGGIYMTLLTKAERGADCRVLTTYAVTAVCRALEELTPLTPMIKWVNDVYVGDLKLAGILAQGAVDPDSGEITHIALGIGLNVFGRVAEELGGIATSLESEGCAVDREALIGRITEIYLSGIEAAASAEITEEYRRRSMLIGCEINVIAPDRTYPAKVVGIGDGCELIVVTESGETEALSSGDVSVRKRKG